MSKFALMKITAIIASCFVSVAMISCGRPTAPDTEVISSTAAFAVYADSLVYGDRIYRSVDTDSTRFTVCVPVIDAITAQALDRMSVRCHPDSMRKACVADLAYSIDLAYGIINPEASMESLRARVRNGRVVQDDGSGGSWPVTVDRVAWISAAYYIYCLTGDRNWLDESFKVADRTLSDDLAVCWDNTYKLMHGAVTWNRRRSPRAYPTWMQPVDLFESMSSGANIEYARAFSVAADMADILGIDRSYFRDISSVITASVNERLWIPNLGYYSDYLYGGVYPLQSQASDNMAQARAIVTGVSDRAHARSVLSKSTWLSDGIPVRFPFIPDVRSDSRVPLPDPLVQAYWNIASARSSDIGSLNTGLGAIYSMAAFDDVGTIENDAAIVAMALGVFAGIIIEPDSMRFAPVIPPAFGGTKRFNGIRYRNAELDVSVSGTGTGIASFSIDGIAAPSCRIGGDLTGHHTVEIVMANNRPSSSEVNMSDPVWMPPVPDVKWVSRREARIINFQAGVSHMVYLNDAYRSLLMGDRYELYDASCYTTVGLVPVADSRRVGLSQRPYQYIPRGHLLTIDATDGGNKGRTQLINNRKLARKFVEIGRRRNRRIRYKINVATEGEYLIDVSYANGSGPSYTGDKCALRTLTVNGRRAGVLVMPQRGTEYWLATGYSNMIRTHLEAGLNTIGIEYREPENINMNKDENTALIQYIRLIKM